MAFSADRALSRAALALVALASCAPSGSHGGTSTSDFIGAFPSLAPALSCSSHLHVTSATPSAVGVAYGRDAGVASLSSTAAPAPGVLPPPIDADAAEPLLFPTNDARRAPQVIRCRAISAQALRIRCMLAHLLGDDPIASKEAIELYERTGDVVGLEVEQMMNGGYRGQLHLVPEPPVGRYRKHLEWVAQALYDYEDFFKGLATAPKDAASDRPIRYRVRPLALRFCRSVGARSPTAFAYDWTVAYNVSGSLNLTADAVRETMFHEIFHLNDRDHRRWSIVALGVIYMDIAGRCGTKTQCLTPYAPTETMIRGGTYYAFHPENGVEEYAAEVALRYYREQRAVLLKKPLGKRPFKCGPEENARSWKLLSDEFFGGVDLVPSCPPR